MVLADEYSYEDLDNETILELFRKHPDPSLTAPEVAETFNVSSQAANNRLKNLYERGKLHRKKVGGSAVIYWLRG